MTAATAASVGVNQPSVMPPIRMTGAISAITAEKSKYQSSASNVTSPSPTAMLVESPASTSSHTTSGKHSTITISIAADPTCRQENGVSLPQPFLWAKYATVAIIIKVMTTPGITPARNSAP